MILVTGAGGFIGKRLVSHFSLRGFEVVPLYRSKKPRIGNDSWEIDLTRPDHIAIVKNSDKKPDTVIHLAGYIDIVLQVDNSTFPGVPIPGVIDIPKIYSGNVTTTANILDICLHLGVKHIIFASSQTVYGMPVTGAFTEESPCAPLEHYANSKVCCEQILRIGTRQGIAVTVLRFPGVYSEERKSGAVYKFCRSAIYDKRISVKSNVPIPFDVLYIDDIIDGFEKALGHGGENWLCLNISTGEPCSLNLLADAVAELVPGCRVEYSKVTQPVVQMDSSRAFAVLGWKARLRRERLQFILDGIRNAI